MSRFPAVVRSLFVIALLIGLPSRDARADLIDYGGGLIYDTVQDLTWLDPAFAQPLHGAAGSSECALVGCDWNYTWTGATAWTAGLSYEGYDDWRLPDKFTPGFYGGDNELHRMLEQLRGWQFDLDPVDGWTLVTAGERGPFQALPEYWLVWMDEANTYTSRAGGGGYDIPDRLTDSRQVRLVRSGAPVSGVPEPSTLALVAVGALVVARFRRSFS